VSWLDDAMYRAFQRARPGRALTLLARTGAPVIGADRYAARSPEAGIDVGTASPVIEPYDAPPVAPGVLDGDVIVKDQVDVEGLATGVGLADRGPVATRDATIIARIRAAGGRLIGKSKMTELGIDGLGTLMHYPMPANPRAPKYCPGGSSTGTAVAVASGLVRYGVAGDGLGSVRIPAAFCGLVGLKPSRERMPRDGIRSPVRTLDAVGPIGRTVEDCATLWQVMAGEPVVPITPFAPPRIGLPVGRSEVRVAASIDAAVSRALGALAALGSNLERVQIRGFDSITFLGGMTGSHEIATGPYAGRTTTGAGRRSLALGRAITASDYARLQVQRTALRETMARVFETTPILAMPTTAIPPPALSKAMLSGESEVLMMRAVGAFTPLANLCDLPAIAVPCGIDRVGRPLSIMFMAAHGHETTLLQIALAIEQAGLAMLPV
jgi:aspartyl-tRNA(Asn)/glutamyl-tRNA(Gln) amidotransferase subunit A